MTAPHTPTQVQDYLARLDAAAADLPADRRVEIVESISDHLDEARAAGEAADETAVRLLLERLGEPEEIVAAAREVEPAPGAPVRRTWQEWKHQSGTTPEGIALLLMTLGSLYLLWPIGVWLMWQSNKWDRWDKLMGTLGVPGGAAMGLYLPLLVRTKTCVPTTGRDGRTDGLNCTGGVPPWVSVALVVLVVLTSLGVAARLWYVARRRAALLPASSTAVAAPSWGGGEIAIVLLAGPAVLLLGALGAMAGLVLLQTSQQWTRRERQVASALLALVVLLRGGLLLIPLAVMRVDEEWTRLLFKGIPAVLSIGVAVGLYLSLRRRITAQRT